MHRFIFKSFKILFFSILISHPAKSNEEPVMIRQNRKTLFLSLFFIIFSLLVLNPRAGAMSFEEANIEIEEFISGFVDMTAVDGTSEAVREKLFKMSLGFAGLYSDIREDRGEFHRKIKGRIAFLSTGQDFKDKKIEKELSGQELYDAMLGEQDYNTRVMGRVEEFVMGILRHLFVYKEHSDKDGEFLSLIFGFAKVYGEIWNDGGTFHRRMQHIVSTLPPDDISKDSDIMLEFQEAMQYNNTLAKEFLVEMVRSRIEPFVNDIIDMAMIPIQNTVKRETLLVTAMNIAKTYGDMTNDHSLHRRIHRRTFTARLSKQVLSLPVDNVHIIDLPKAKRRKVNKFVPDNIAIRLGETVRWENNDKKIHVIGTFDFLSDAQFFNPNLSPGDGFEHTFEEPGEYYYICYIHRSMIGRILVEE